MDVRLTGITMDDNVIQYAKAYLPIVNILFGKLSDYKMAQLKKAASPILVILFGIITDSRPLQ